MITTLNAPPPPADLVAQEEGGASRSFLDCRGERHDLPVVDLVADRMC